MTVNWAVSVTICKKTQLLTDCLGNLEYLFGSSVEWAPLSFRCSSSWLGVSLGIHLGFDNLLSCRAT